MKLRLIIQPQNFSPWHLEKVEKIVLLVLGYGYVNHNSVCYDVNIFTFLPISVKFILVFSYLHTVLQKHFVLLLFFADCLHFVALDKIYQFNSNSNKGQGFTAP